MKTITIQVSDELASLAQGFAGYFKQSVEEYAVASLLCTVQGDCEASHHEQTPEFQVAAKGK